MQKSSEYPIKFLCKTFEVSRSTYYEWLKGGESNRRRENRALSAEIRAVYNETQQTYGAIRIHKELKFKGKNCSKNRVARLMRIENIRSIHRTKFKACTTNSKHSLSVADNVINQDFTATAPNQKWGADITYIKTGEGFVYLAVVLDFFSRKIVGWAVADNANAALCCSALKMALTRRQLPKELIHHSDRGVQYASSDYRQILLKNNFSQSMSRTGNCFDNAMVESFIHTLKVERVHRRAYLNKLSAHIDIADYIENFYNSKRRHSSIDYLSPVDYEANLKNVA